MLGLALSPAEHTQHKHTMYAEGITDVASEPPCHTVTDRGVKATTRIHDLSSGSTHYIQPVLSSHYRLK